ncbi:MAG: hypothetical protein ACLR8U_09635 [Oscillospiraceae bacterium]
MRRSAAWATSWGPAYDGKNSPELLPCRHLGASCQRALFFGVMYRDYEDEAFARLRAETSAIAQGLGAQGASYFDGFIPSDRVTWVDASGSVLYDSAAPADQLSNHTGREEIDRALEDGEAQSSRYSQTLLQRTFYYARRMTDGTVLRVSCTQNSLPAMVLMLLTPFYGSRRSFSSSAACCLIGSRRASQSPSTPFIWITPPLCPATPNSRRFLTSSASRTAPSASR